MKPPIFIIGSGRCGSSILFKMMAHHKSFAWHSSIENAMPNSKIIKKISDLCSRSYIYKFMPAKFKPLETYNVWDTCDKVIKHPFRPIFAKDVREISRVKIKGMIADKVRSSQGEFYLAKFTGWSRIGYFKEIFPDAKFIHIKRDGRAAVNSYLNFEFFWWHSGISNWKFALQHYPAKAKKYDYCFVALAALAWLGTMEEIKESSISLDRNTFLEIKYEQLVGDKENTLEIICDFCGVDREKHFFKDVEKYRLSDNNYKYINDLTRHQQIALTEILGEWLLENGYKL